MMYFTGTLSSNTGSILSPNKTDEVSNEFLESVSIILLYGYCKVITLSSYNSLEAMLNTFLDVCIRPLTFLTLHFEKIFEDKLIG